MAKSELKEILRIVMSLQASVERLEKRFDSLERGYDRLKVDVSELKTDVSELKTDVSGLKIGGSGLRAEMLALRNDLMNKMDSLAAMFSGNDETLLMLKVRTSRHEDDIYKIKRKVGLNKFT